MLEYILQDVPYANDRIEKSHPRQLQHRINHNYNAMISLSMDLKVMLR